MDVFEKAAAFALRAHGGMTRKRTNTPYILHPMEAACIVGTMTDDREILAAAVLHDVVEDTPVTAEEIRETFGDRIAELVASETEDKMEGRPKSETWMERKKESIARLRGSTDPAVHMIWLGDKLSNLRGFYRQYEKTGADLWKEFNQKDPEVQHWYYRTVAETIRDLEPHPAWKEFDALIRLIFEGERIWD